MEGPASLLVNLGLTQWPQPLQESLILPPLFWLLCLCHLEASCSLRSTAVQPPGSSEPELCVARLLRDHPLTWVCVGLYMCTCVLSVHVSTHE